MKRPDTTDMGGDKSRFQTTDWDEIQKARTWDADRQREVIGNLIARYWKPVYCYLVRKGYDDELAKDLTQDFFHEVVLGRDLIQKADVAKGRFRTFLLTALRNYVIDRDYRVHSHPRLIPLEDINGTLPSQEMKPDQAFTYTWVSLLLDSVIADVERGCHQDSQEIHWKLFCARVLEPTMEGTKPPPINELCSKLSIENRNNKASNMIVTVKRRFRRVLEEYLQQDAEPDSDVRDELNELGRTLCEGGAR
jgi:RNA polymerase sigma-70 factor (ECF subfamily)